MSKPWWSECGSRFSSMGVAWERPRDSESQFPPQSYGVRACGSHAVWESVCTLKLGMHHGRLSLGTSFIKMDSLGWALQGPFAVASQVHTVTPQGN